MSSRTRKLQSTCARLLILCCALALVLAGSSSRIERARAQTAGPMLISHETSTRAVAFESVTEMREPFPVTQTVQFSADNRTRINLFAQNINLQPGDTTADLTAEAEDAAHKIYPLKVEYVGPVPDQTWVTSVIVRLNDEMGDLGDVLVKITYKGQPSNRVRVGIGHTGGGPEDDAGAVPTPGTTDPRFAGNPITAGNLSQDDVRTLISQAVSAAVALNKAVTVAVTDKEGNVLGLFQMTGAPSNV
ncbi:MAG TPA: hypothetical protein VEV81_00445, partial [Pyrinomonadaceae bacterium]|nr:hypothetical protein [Pyrinomonadaceae bacterium]